MIRSLSPAAGAVRDAAASWFFENSADGFAVSRDGVILSVNRAWLRICESTAEETIGRKGAELVHPDDLDQFISTGQILRETGEVSTELRIRTGGGATVWVRVSVKRGEDGLTLNVIHDITADRAKREEAEATERALDLLRCTSGVYIWRFDPETGRYAAQPDRRRDPAVTGGPGERDMSRRDINAEIHPDDMAMVAAAFADAVRTGEAGEVWYRHLVEPGVWSRFRATWRGVRQHANRMWEIIGLAQDMTEMADARDAAREGARLAEAAKESQSRFLANMSHEIRTPLNGVIGVLHILKDETLSSDARDLLEEAVACGHMLGQLVNDLLDFSKIEAGHLELSPQPTDPALVVEGLAGMLRAQTEARGLYLRTDIGPLAGAVSIDPDRFRQVLFNLIGNAAKFTIHGGVSIRLRGRGEGAGHRLRVEVEDTGVGISAAGQSRLFQRFQQGDSSTTREFGGTGLGLAITRRLTELMDGEVGFDSVEGRGSTFWIDIAAPISRAAEDAAPAGGESPLGGLTVLVVDDNAVNRLVASKILQSLGARVETADNGALAVEAAVAVAYDLIFMDVQMPVMDGPEATRRIRALPGPTGRTPILAMTANVMDHQISDYRAAGMDGVVAKPLFPGAILAEVARLAGVGEERLAVEG